MGGIESWRDLGTREGMNESGRKGVRTEGGSEEVWEGGVLAGSLLRAMDGVFPRRRGGESVERECGSELGGRGWIEAWREGVRGEWVQE